MKTEYPKNVLFVDFDGCVTCEKDGTYFNPDPAKYGPSAEIIERLIDFCRETESKIAISSNWRKFDPDGVWKNGKNSYPNPLRKFVAALGNFHFGTLSPERHVPKSKAIAKWLEDNPDFRENFVVFDDDPNEKLDAATDFGINERFLPVDPKFGITDELLTKAEKILKGYSK